MASTATIPPADLIPVGHPLHGTIWSIPIRSLELVARHLDRKSLYRFSTTCSEYYKLFRWHTYQILIIDCCADLPTYDSKKMLDQRPIVSLATFLTFDSSNFLAQFRPMYLIFDFYHNVLSDYLDMLEIQTQLPKILSTYRGIKGIMMRGGPPPRQEIPGMFMFNPRFFHRYGIHLRQSIGDFWSPDVIHQKWILGATEEFLARVVDSNLIFSNLTTLTIRPRKCVFLGYKADMGLSFVIPCKERLDFGKLALALNMMPNLANLQLVVWSMADYLQLRWIIKAGGFKSFEVELPLPFEDDPTSTQDTDYEFSIPIIIPATSLIFRAPSHGVTLSPNALNVYLNLTYPRLKSYCFEDYDVYSLNLIMGVVNVTRTECLSNLTLRLFGYCGLWGFIMNTSLFPSVISFDLEYCRDSSIEHVQIPLLDVLFLTLRKQCNFKAPEQLLGDFLMTIPYKSELFPFISDPATFYYLVRVISNPNPSVIFQDVPLPKVRLEGTENSSIDKITGTTQITLDTCYLSVFLESLYAKSLFNFPQLQSLTVRNLPPSLSSFGLESLLINHSALQVVTFECSPLEIPFINAAISHITASHNYLFSMMTEFRLPTNLKLVIPTIASLSLQYQQDNTGLIQS